MSKTVRQEMEARKHYVTFQKSGPLDPEAHLREFCNSGWDDLAARVVGDAQDVSAVYENAAHAMHHVREASLAQVREGFTISEELDHAMLLTHLAAGTVTASLLLHLRAAQWFENGAATLLRTALEALASAGALIAGGTEHKKVWLERRGRIATRDSIPFLFELLRTRRPDISDPAAVYSWLSQSVHWDLPGIQRHGGAPSHADIYYAVAYLSWACMVIAEVATGYEHVAVWPQRWPESLPWDRDSPRT